MIDKTKQYDATKGDIKAKPDWIEELTSNKSLPKADTFKTWVNLHSKGSAYVKKYAFRFFFEFLDDMYPLPNKKKWNAIELEAWHMRDNERFHKGMFKKIVGVYFPKWLRQQENKRFKGETLSDGTVRLICINVRGYFEYIDMPLGIKDMSIIKGRNRKKRKRFVPTMEHINFKCI